MFQTMSTCLSMKHPVKVGIQLAFTLIIVVFTSVDIIYSSTYKMHQRVLTCFFYERVSKIKCVQGKIPFFDFFGRLMTNKAVFY
jgi:hypothetical protein